MSFLFSSGNESDSVSPTQGMSKTTIKEANGHIQALFDRVNELEVEREQFLETLHEKESNLVALSSAVDRLQESEVQKDLEIKSLRLTVTEQDAIVEQLQSKLLKEDGSEDEDVDKISDLNATIESLRSSCEDLRHKESQESDEAKKWADKFHALRKRLARCEKELEAAEEERASLAAQLSTSSGQVFQLTEMVREEQMRLAVAEHRSRQLETLLKSSETKLEEADRLRLILKDLSIFTPSVENLSLALKRVLTVPGLVLDVNDNAEVLQLDLKEEEEAELEALTPKERNGEVIAESTVEGSSQTVGANEDLLTSAEATLEIVNVVEVSATEAIQKPITEDVPESLEEEVTKAMETSKTETEELNSEIETKEQKSLDTIVVNVARPIVQSNPFDEETSAEASAAASTDVPQSGKDESVAPEPEDTENAHESVEVNFSGNGDWDTEETAQIDDVPLLSLDEPMEEIDPFTAIPTGVSEVIHLSADISTSVADGSVTRLSEDPQPEDHAERVVENVISALMESVESEEVKGCDLDEEVPYNDADPGVEEDPAKVLPPTTLTEVNVERPETWNANGILEPADAPEGDGEEAASKAPVVDLQLAMDIATQLISPMAPDQKDASPGEEGDAKINVDVVEGSQDTSEFFV